MAHKEGEPPAGWQVEAFVNWDEQGKADVRSIDSPNDITDDNALRADSVIVSKTGALGKDYYYVHGPFDELDNIYDYIETDMEDKYG